MTTLSRRSLLLSTGGTAALLAVGALPAVATHTSPDPGVILGWNQELLRIVRTPGAQPATVHATRSFAIMHAAMLDAVMATTASGRPYLFRVNARRDAAPVAAAAQAAHDVLASLYPTMAGQLDQRLAADLASVADPLARQAGSRVGALAARLLLALRQNDGSAATPVPLAPGTAPGEYRPTPPGFAAAVFTHWPAVTPFLLDRADQFRSARYPDLTGTRYAAAANEVKLLGQDTSTARTADQTIQARFWAAPIWNYWNEIAQTAVRARHADLVTATRVFARLALAFADAVIAFYDGKYHYRIWRPITAVRLAGTDGNPATAEDPNWNGLATTPADPAYPGAHSVISQAGSAILREAFGPAVRVPVTSEVLPGTVRTFARFQDIADEAGRSRVFAGLHSDLDHEAGQRLGDRVARLARGEV